MVDPADDPSRATFRLIYRSHMRIPEHERKAELGEIFSTARSNNKRLGVSGALLVWHDQFVQTLEGDENIVRDLYATIHDDPRHERVTVLEEEMVPARVFGRWSMARVSDDDGPDIPLLMNRDKGGITPAAPRETTPEQDDLVATMREYVRTTTTA
ncbi:BLUF domain-containing protein [Actinomycetospora cinnamomea]|uniref:FAD-dependent sensor of blue light n=1 Tax=Actinomycetospora cinnamomea TaxID=663609 RepID=A0A2U1FR51_9PSEU|nr:BLUF domain-containing protein [Actinomycetospora cinnamomea]PVZ14665.1 FAD-dependent sensor of blue light [Actinomycetospora cinnamomea]